MTDKPKLPEFKKLIKLLDRFGETYTREWESGRLWYYAAGLFAALIALAVSEHVREYAMWLVIGIAAMVGASIMLATFLFILIGVLSVMFKFIFEPIMDFWAHKMEWWW